MLKLPVFVVHYMEHKAATTDLSFMDFVQLHYFNGHPKDGDHTRDSQLPFSTNDIVIINSTVVLTEQAVMDFAPTVYREQTYPLFSFQQLLPSHTSDIWQPPKTS
jgi:hypothetical protein